MNGWKKQLRYLACHSIVNGQCTCGKTDCSHPGKHPCEKGWQEKATNDPELVGNIHRNPKINPAIACGAASGIVVLDIDGQEGSDSLRGRIWSPRETTDYRSASVSTP
jgi:hypothetical protein